MASPDGGGDESENSGSRTESETDSDLEYTDSESDSSDSYVYPWDTSEDDSWADLSSDDVIQKILLKLPTYDPPDSNDDSKSDDSFSLGSQSDSMKINSDKDVFDLDFKDPPRLDLYDNEITDEDDDNKGDGTNESNNEMTDNKTNNSNEQILRSQLRGYNPHLYLQSYEHFGMYIENGDVSSQDGDIDIAASSDESGHSDGNVDDIKTPNDAIINTPDDSDNPVTPSPVSSVGDDNPTTPTTVDPTPDPTPDATADTTPTVDDQTPTTTTTTPGTEYDIAGNTKIDTNVGGNAGNAGGVAPISLQPSTSDTVRTPSPAPDNRNSKNNSDSSLATGETTPKSPSKKKSNTNKKNTGRTSSKIKLTSNKSSGRKSKELKGKMVQIDVETIVKTDVDDETKAKRAAKRRERAMSRATRKGGKKRVGKKGDIHRRFRVGDEVVVKGKDKGQGIIRYMGHATPPAENESNETTPTENGSDLSSIKGKSPTAEKRPIWYGVELIESTAIGDSDGTFNDYQWFECPQNKAVFVHRKKIRKFFAQTTLKHEKMLKMRRGRHNAQLFGLAIEQLFQERIKTAQTRHVRAPRKLGPRDMGRVHGFVGGDKLYKIEQSKGGFLDERISGRYSETANMPKEKKLGPRDIGTAHGWIGSKMDDTAQRVQRAKEQMKKEEQHRLALEDSKKLGPREIGTAHGWKGTKVDSTKDRKRKQKEEQRRKAEEERILQESRKVGPRDVGTAHGWKGTKADSTKDRKRKQKEEQRRREEEAKVLNEIKKEKQVGPRDMGKPKGWKGMKYDEKEQEVKRAKKKQKEERMKKKEKDIKLGPRDVGKVKGWKGTKYDEKEAERKRIAKLEAEERKKREKVGKKLGPREIRKGSTTGATSPKKSKK